MDTSFVKSDYLKDIEEKWDDVVYYSVWQNYFVILTLILTQILLFQYILNYCIPTISASWFTKAVSIVGLAGSSVMANIPVIFTIQSLRNMDLSHSIYNRYYRFFNFIAIAVFTIYLLISIFFFHDLSQPIFRIGCIQLLTAYTLGLLQLIIRFDTVNHFRNDLFVLYALLIFSITIFYYIVLHYVFNVTMIYAVNLIFLSAHVIAYFLFCWICKFLNTPDDLRKCKNQIQNTKKLDEYNTNKKKGIIKGFENEEDKLRIKDLDTTDSMVLPICLCSYLQSNIWRSVIVITTTIFGYGLITLFQTYTGFTIIPGEVQLWINSVMISLKYYFGIITWNNVWYIEAADYVLAGGLPVVMYLTYRHNYLKNTNIAEQAFSYSYTYLLVFSMIAGLVGAFFPYIFSYLATYLPLISMLKYSIFILPLLYLVDCWSYYLDITRGNILSFSKTAKTIWQYVYFLFGILVFEVLLAIVAFLSFGYVSALTLGSESHYIISFPIILIIIFVIVSLVYCTENMVMSIFVRNKLGIGKFNEKNLVTIFITNFVYYIFLLVPYIVCIFGKGYLHTNEKMIYLAHFFESPIIIIYKISCAAILVGMILYIMSPSQRLSLFKRIKTIVCTPLVFLNNIFSKKMMKENIKENQVKVLSEGHVNESK